MLYTSKIDRLFLFNRFLAYINIIFNRLTVTLLPGNKRLAYVSSIAFCLSPPAMFMSSFYTESLFALLTFTGMRWIAQKKYLYAAVTWGFTSAVRSNAIVYCGFFFYDLIWVHLIHRKVYIQQTSFGSIHIEVTCIIESHSRFIAIYSLYYDNIFRFSYFSILWIYPILLFR